MGEVPQLFSGVAHLVPVPLSWGSESGGEFCARRPATPCSCGSEAGAPLPLARVTRRLALLPSRPPRTGAPAPFLAVSCSMHPLPQPELPVAWLAGVGTPSGTHAPCLPQGARAALCRVLPWLIEGSSGAQVLRKVGATHSLLNSAHLKVPACCLGDIGRPFACSG